MSKPAQDPSSHLQFILSVLENAQPLSVNWTGVASDNGIGYARNANTKFKDTLKKYGYKFDTNQVMKTDDESSAPANTTVEAPKTPKAKKTSKTPASKKRKLETVQEDDEIEDGEVEAERA